MRAVRPLVLMSYSQKSKEQWIVKFSREDWLDYGPLLKGGQEETEHLVPS